MTNDRRPAAADLTLSLSPGRQACAPVPAGTRTIFFDSWSGHHFLYDSYAAIPNSSLVIAPGQQWHNPRRTDLYFLEHSLIGSVQHIVFLTLDPYVYSPGFAEFERFLAALGSNIQVHGILHRFSPRAEQLSKLQSVAVKLSVIVLDEDLQRTLISEHHLPAVHYLPLHPVLEDWLIPRPVARQRLGLPADKTVIALLGELRPGKGVRRLMAALKYLPEQTKKHCIFTICGRAKDIDPDSIQQAFDDAGVALQLVSRQVEHSYILLPDSIMGAYISASDIGLFLYHSVQRTCVSGVLPNFVAAGIPVLASSDSTVGELVAHKGLGWTADSDNPIALAMAIEQAVRNTREGQTPKPNHAYVKDQHTEAVLARLNSLLGT